MKKIKKNILGFLVGLSGCALLSFAVLIAILTVSLPFQLLMTLLAAILVASVIEIYSKKEFGFLWLIPFIVFFVVFIPTALYFASYGIQLYFILSVVAAKGTGILLVSFGFSAIEK